MAQTNQVDDGIQHGIDDDPKNDAEKGAALGGAGGAVAGAAAGSMTGPVGAVVGAVAGGLIGAVASGAAVGTVDAVDNDNNMTGLGDHVDRDNDRGIGMGTSSGTTTSSAYDDHALSDDTTNPNAATSRGDDTEMVGANSGMATPGSYGTTGSSLDDTMGATRSNLGIDEGATETFTPGLVGGSMTAPALHNDQTGVNDAPHDWGMDADYAENADTAQVNSDTPSAEEDARAQAADLAENRAQGDMAAENQRRNY